MYKLLIDKVFAVFFLNNSGECVYIKKMLHSNQSTYPIYFFLLSVERRKGKFYYIFPRTVPDRETPSAYLFFAKLYECERVTLIKRIASEFM